MKKYILIAFVFLSSNAFANRTVLKKFLCESQKYTVDVEISTDTLAGAAIDWVVRSKVEEGEIYFLAPLLTDVSKVADLDKATIFGGMSPLDSAIQIENGTDGLLALPPTIEAEDIRLTCVEQKL